MTGSGADFESANRRRATSDTCDWCGGARLETVHDSELNREFDVCERHLRATDEWAADYEVVES